jgi:hypothetical protein
VFPLKKEDFKMSNYKRFIENYELWRNKAWEEFVNGEFYEGQEKSQVEICEDGTVYPYEGQLAYIKDCITSWENSEFYIE